MIYEKLFNKVLNQEYKLQQRTFLTRELLNLRIKKLICLLLGILSLGIGIGNIYGIVGSLCVAFFICLELNANIDFAANKYLGATVKIRIPMDSITIEFDRMVPDTHIIRTTTRKDGSFTPMAFTVQSVYFKQDGSKEEPELEAIIYPADFYRGQYHKATIPYTDLEEDYDIILSPEDIELMKVDYAKEMFKEDCKELYS